jgi:hypothetical protein
MLREPRTGRPAPVARLVALLVVLGMVAATGPLLLHVVAWVLTMI